MVNRDVPQSQQNLEASAPLNLGENPYAAFEIWLDEAKRVVTPEPTAMSLATATLDGIPSLRTVLFKGWGDLADGRRALRFYTNYTSQKSKDLIENPMAALLFYWGALDRQVRFEGVVTRLSESDSLKYFQSRPRESQLSAWASPQSQVIASREDLEMKMHEIEHRFRGIEKLPLPPFWGGWQVEPTSIEFWEARPARFHERREYSWLNGKWKQAILAP